MHAFTHSLAHRGTPASRTARPRWQPYNAIPPVSTVASRSSSSSYLHTPSSPSVQTSSPATSISSVCEPESPRAQSLNPSSTPRDGPSRDAQKSKYVVGLVDQAVHALNDIWRPQDIPDAFLITSRPTLAASSTMPLMKSKHAYLMATRKLDTHNHQLPSPTTPTTQESPSSAYVACATNVSHGQSSGAQAPRSNLVPIKGFVHEVLRRSRTSGSVLQTALCYLEAIRLKVPELLEQERNGAASFDETAEENRVVVGGVADDFDIAMDEGVQTELCQEPIASFDGFADLGSIDRPFLGATFAPQAVPTAPPLDSRICRGPTQPPTPLPRLPSPLLCPRRAFLAALILASKFTLDRCYSNRAWAKLSGLPPREIGRCERALGAALEWRLWVGKSAATATAGTPPGRGIRRTSSESEVVLGSTPNASSSSLSASTSFGTSSNGVQTEATRPKATRRGSLLNRSKSASLRSAATLPPNAFSSNYSLAVTAPSPVAESTVHANAFNPAFLLPQSMWTQPPQCQGEDPSQYYACDQGSSPRTPMLVHSPSSTESSSGDRTIQMPSMPTPPQGQFAHFAGTKAEANFFGALPTPNVVHVWNPTTYSSDYTLNVSIPAQYSSDGQSDCSYVPWTS